MTFSTLVSVPSREDHHSTDRPRVIGLGAGGHASVVIESLQCSGNVELLGLVALEPRSSVLGVPVLGADDDLPELIKSLEVDSLFLGIGMITSAQPRKRLVDRLEPLACRYVPVIDSRAIVSTSVSIGDGPQILAGAIIQSRCRLGHHVIVNTGVIVEHDCRLGDFVHVASGATLAGGVIVEQGAFVGAGACIKQGVRIGEEAVVGMGAVVVSDVPPGATVVGVPARLLARQGPIGGAT